MSFEIGVTGSFESAHSLKGEKFGPASKLHGHTYKVEVVLGGEELSKDGVLCDIVEVRSALDEITKKIHYKVLDEVEEISGMNSTAEEMARFVFRGISARINDKSRLKHMKVTVWENQSNFASFKDRI